jgi:DUF1365 family protein
MNKAEKNCIDQSGSAIYTGWVSHHRFSPRPHGFRYQVFMMFLNLDELPKLFNGFKLWSYQRRNLAWFKRADYYGNPDLPLKDEISKLLLQATGNHARGAVCMLTNMRYFGCCFNPVTFYYCFEPDGTTLQAMVSHITNTPWGEDYVYVHDYSKTADGSAAENTAAAFRFSKTFHVSPFMPMDIEYDWSFKFDADQLLIHMKNMQHGTQIFNAVLALKRSAISERRLNWLLLSYPFMTFKVIAAIYWNALQLWLKRVPFHTHPNPVKK